MKVPKRSRKASLAKATYTGDKGVVERRQDPARRGALFFDPAKFFVLLGDPSIHELAKKVRDPPLRLFANHRGSDGSARSTNKDVFEKLSRAPSSSAVDVPPLALFKDEARFFEDPRVETPTVIDDDHDRRSRLHESGGVSKGRRDPVDITIKRASTHAPIGWADFQFAEIWKIQQLVCVAMLLVVI